MTTMLEASSLVKHFGSIQAVNGISLTVNKGEVLGFLGPNGAGKTTTMKMLTGFLNPTSGTASVCGFNIADQPIAAKRKLGYLPEGAPAYGDMTPRGFLSFIADIRRIEDKAGAIDSASRRVHLQTVLDQPIETLSKGFRRRVGLAQAILHDPDVLILDEPTDGLDPNQKFEVRNLIAEMATEKAIIISTHILEEVDAVCGRAVIIDRGRIVADGTPQELKARSRTHGAVILTVSAADAGGIAEKLAALAGVKEVERTDVGATTRLVTIPAGGADLVRTIRSAMDRENWMVEQFEIDPGRLDDLFRSLTHADADIKAEAA